MREKSILDNEIENNEPVKVPTDLPVFTMSIDMPDGASSWDVRRSVFDRRVVIFLDKTKAIISSVSLGPIIEIIKEEKIGTKLMISYHNEHTDTNKTITATNFETPRPKINGRRV